MLRMRLKHILLCTEILLIASPLHIVGCCAIMTTPRTRYRSLSNHVACLHISEFRPAYLREVLLSAQLKQQESWRMPVTARYTTDSEIRTRTVICHGSHQWNWKCYMPLLPRYYNRFQVGLNANQLRNYRGERGMVQIYCGSFGSLSRKIEHYSYHAPTYLQKMYLICEY